MKALLAMALCAISLRAQETTNSVAATNSTPVAPTSFEAFKVIRERNIFDPNRTAPRSGREERREEKPKRTETFTLLGSISYDKGDFAFFDGSRSEYRKSVKAGETIAGYKVAEVSSKQVTLEVEGKKVELPVGSQMKRAEGEEWQVSAHVEPTTASSSSASTESASSGETNSSSGSGEASEVLKRLIERAKQGK